MGRWDGLQACGPEFHPPSPGKGRRERAPQSHPLSSICCGMHVQTQQTYPTYAVACTCTYTNTNTPHTHTHNTDFLKWNEVSMSSRYLCFYVHGSQEERNLSCPSVVEQTREYGPVTYFILWSLYKGNLGYLPQGCAWKVFSRWSELDSENKHYMITLAWTVKPLNSQN